jgi:gamma-glutamyltranspeptidase/glutathione hydrolase
VFLNPPPAQSGFLIEVSLALLKERLRTESAVLPLTELVLALDITNQVRRELARAGLPEGVSVPISGDTRFADYLERFRKGVRTSARSNEGLTTGSTTHVSVLDSEGNAASVTTTNGEGCGHFLPGLGFMMNNMLGEEDINPRGFHKYLPGQRLCSMIAPTIVRKESRPVLLTGTAGSNRIRSVILQLLINVLHRCMSVQDATNAPRVHLEGNVLSVEPGLDEKQLADLEKSYLVQRWRERNLFFGGANSVTPEGGAGDARRSGASLCC